MFSNLARDANHAPHQGIGWRFDLNAPGPRHLVRTRVVDGYDPSRSDFTTKMPRDYNVPGLVNSSAAAISSNYPFPFHV
jgi:hypothetical protein